MALALNKILIATANANTAGAYFQGVSNISATTAGNVIPAGTYYVFGTANVVIQAMSNFNTSTNVATFSNVYSTNSGGLVISDNVSVRLLATTNAAVQLITVNGGQDVSGTFNV